MDKNNRDSLKTRKVVNDGLPDSELAKVSDLLRQRRKLIKASATVIPALMTLRSGAAAALTSTANRCLKNPDTPINTTSDVGVDVGGIDPVMGDYEAAHPLDEWLRVVACPCLRFMLAPGNSSNEKPFYCVRKDNTLSPWDDVEGWLIYDKDGNPKDKRSRTKLLEDPDFNTAWVNRVTIYGVDSYPDGWVFIDDSGGPVDPPVPALVRSYMETSTTRCYLLCYYNEGVLTYYPMPQGEALLITGSCLCSINPAFQL